MTRAGGDVFAALLRACRHAQNPTTSAIAASSLRRSAVNEAIKPPMAGLDQRNDSRAHCCHECYMSSRAGAKRLFVISTEDFEHDNYCLGCAHCWFAADYPRRAAVISWIFFDWAAQPYFTLITTFVFAPYFATHVASNPASGQAMWGFATAAAGLVIALLSPVLGAIADASGRRKPWIAAFGALLVIGSCSDVVRKARRPQRDSGTAAGLRDRDHRRRIRHGLQQRDDAVAGAARQDRAIVRHRLGHRLCRRHYQPDPGARISGGQPGHRAHAVRIHAAVRSRSRDASGRSHHRPADRDLVHHFRDAVVPADAGLSGEAAGARCVARGL